jgi:hypothetical protein
MSKSGGNDMSEMRLLVYRRLDNRFEGLSDDSPRALELHNRRKNALHEVLDEEPGWRVEDWGLTDDSQPHELVELVVAILGSPQFQAVAVPALTFLGGTMVKAAIDEVTSEAVKSLIARLRPKQKQEQILDFEIRLPDVILRRRMPRSP